jgi:hypothetical protein
MNIIEAIQHEKLLRPSFTERGAPLETWNFWLTVLKFGFALPIEDRKERAFIKAVAGLERFVQPDEPFRTITILAGRRSGKSRITAAIAVYLSTLAGMEKYLSGGEFGYVLITAVDKLQSQIVKRYCANMLRKSPILRKMIRAERTNEIELTNNVIISIRPASYRSVRGYTLIAAILDEAAHYRSDESANPASELVKALRPGLLTIPKSMLILPTSVFGKYGIAYEAFRKNYGTIKKGSPLVIKATSLQMNPMLPKVEIDQELIDDPSGAGAEYLSIFRSDVEAFLNEENVEACIVENRFQLPKILNQRYKCFVDFAGGSGKDSATMAIAHSEEGRVILDATRERKPPFKPSEVIKEFSEVMKIYDVRSAHADRYAGQFVVEGFAEHKISIKPSEMTKTEIYQEMLALILNQTCELLDDRRIVSQFCNLERKTHAGGRQSIDHGLGCHDDLVNAISGACTLLSLKHTKALFKIGTVDMY